MADYGLTVTRKEEMVRLTLRCPHQNGVLYVVRGEKSWVCNPEHLHAHALAGLMAELASLQDPKVKEAMQRWGVYFRSLPLEEEAQENPAVSGDGHAN